MGVVLQCDGVGEECSDMFTAETVVALRVHNQLGYLKRAACIVEHLRCSSNNVIEPLAFVVDFDGREAVAVRRVT